MKREYKIWDANDLALLIYAKYKGLTNEQIALLLDSTKSAVSTKAWRIQNPEGLGAGERKMINKAGQLEYRVRSGEAPEMRAMWDRRIGEINKIKYDYLTQTPPSESVVYQTASANNDNECNDSDWDDDDDKEASLSASASEEATPVRELATILEIKADLEALDVLMSLLKKD